MEKGLLVTKAVLRIRDIYPGSRIWFFPNPDFYPSWSRGQKGTGSQIQDPQPCFKVYSKFLFISFQVFRVKFQININKRSVLSMHFVKWCKIDYTCRIWRELPVYSELAMQAPCHTALQTSKAKTSFIVSVHRLNMELDFQSLLGLLWTAALVGWDPATPPFPPHLGSYTRALLVSKIDGISF